jgi:hypothetical protein
MLCGFTHTICPPPVTPPPLISARNVRALCRCAALQDDVTDLGDKKDEFEGKAGVDLGVAFGLIFLLLWLVPLLATCGVWRYRKGCSNFGCCLIFVIILYFSVIMGMFSTSAVVLDDLCAQHVEIIKDRTATETFNFDGTVINIGDTIDQLLHCKDDNFVDILGIGDSFDISADTADVAMIASDSAEELRSHLMDIDTALADLQGVGVYLFGGVGVVC